MACIIASPSRYVQGNGVLAQLCTHAVPFGKKLFVLVSESGKKRVADTIASGVGSTGASLHYEIFRGECSREEIERITTAIATTGCEAVIGIGGGKIHDTAKAAAYYAKLPVIIVPTIASTDAPCSALSVIYTPNGVFEEYLFLPTSPNMVLVDTAMVAQAPARLLVAGMGDALATYFEARACVQSGAINCVGGNTTLAAMHLAELCFETLLADGYQAKIAVDNKACTRAVENIVEANTYLSGIGFESGGLAAAHAIHNGMTVLSDTHHLYHGEKVAFGTLVQLILENATEDIETVFGFCKQVGLPVTFKELGMNTLDQALLMEAATLACAEGDTMGNMPFTVTPQDVYSAMITVDALGRQ